MSTLPMVDAASLISKKTIVKPRAVKSSTGKTGSTEKTKPPRTKKDSPMIDEMQLIKQNIGLTARQFTNEMRLYEEQNREQTLEICAKHGVEYTELTQNTFSAYVEGWVRNDANIAAFLDRMRVAGTFFYEEAKKGKMVNNLDLLDKKTLGFTMRPKMDEWFKKLGIPADNKRISPFRALSKLIAPHYKRLITAKEAGVFRIVKVGPRLIEYVILHPKTKGVKTMKSNDLIEAAQVVYKDLWTDEDLLVRDGELVKKHQGLQYGVWLTKNVKTGEMEILKDHVTYWRWYDEDRTPPSVVMINDIEAAIEAFLKSGGRTIVKEMFEGRLTPNDKVQAIAPLRSVPKTEKVTRGTTTTKRTSVKNKAT